MTIGYPLSNAERNLGLFRNKYSQIWAKSEWSLPTMAPRWVSRSCQNPGQRIANSIFNLIHWVGSQVLICKDWKDSNLNFMALDTLSFFADQWNICKVYVTPDVKLSSFLADTIFKRFMSVYLPALASGYSLECHQNGWTCGIWAKFGADWLAGKFWADGAPRTPGSLYLGPLASLCSRLWELGSRFSAVFVCFCWLCWTNFGTLALNPQ